MKMENQGNEFPDACRKNANRRGYTLIEISLAILVLGIGLSGILSVFPVAISWGGQAIASRTGSLAARNVASQLEELASGTEARFYFWEPDFAYAEGVSGEPGDFVFPTTPNGYYYECIRGGNSDGPEMSKEPFGPGDKENDEINDGGTKWKCRRALIRVPEYPIWQPSFHYEKGDYASPTMNGLNADEIQDLRKYRFRCVTDSGGQSSSTEPDWTVVDADNRVQDGAQLQWERERYEGYYCTFFLHNSFPTEAHKWQADTAYKKGDYLMIPARKRRAVCVVGGTSGGSGNEPSWGIYNDGDTITDNEVTWRCEVIDPGDLWVAGESYETGDIISPAGSNYQYKCTNGGISDADPAREPEWYKYITAGDVLPADGTVTWECLGFNTFRRVVIQVHRQDPESPQYGEAADLLGVYESGVYDD